MPLLDLFWAMLWFFLFFAWLMLLFRVFTDIFRAESSGWTKAAWTVFVIVLPIFGVLVYLIANGSEMHQRQASDLVAMDQAQREYIRSAAGTVPSTAEEISKLANLRDTGVISEDEFRMQKQRVMAGSR